MTPAENELCDVRSGSGIITGAKRRGIVKTSIISQARSAFLFPSFVKRGEGRFLKINMGPRNSQDLEASTERVAA